MKKEDIEDSFEVTCKDCGCLLGYAETNEAAWKMVKKSGWKRVFRNKRFDIVCPVCRGDKHADKPLADKVVV